MPKQKVTREDILNAAAEIVRKEGAEALNARSLARELGVSTQPIYSQFASMEALTKALTEKAAAEYRRRIDGYIEAHCATRYLAYGLGYVSFAREERGLFLLLSGSFNHNYLAGVEEPYLEDIIGEMKSIYGMDEERALAFHRDMAIYAYGLAMLQSCGRTMTDEEITKRFNAEFAALYGFYFPDLPPIPRKKPCMNGETYECD